MRFAKRLKPKTQHLTPVLLLSLLSLNIYAQAKPDRDYLVFVVCESADKIVLIRFGPGGARIEREFESKPIPVDMNGPHGVGVTRDKRHYYVSFGHGRPFGNLFKYDAETDRVLGRVTLGPFPATLDLTPDGQFLYVVNFNLHGDMVPSSVSVVATEFMQEIARIKTCVMPHGSRINAAGTRHYSACMMDDMLVEIDTGALKVSRHFKVTRGKEAGASGPPPVAANDHAHHNAGHGENSCSPTWAQPSVDGRSVYVACNQSDEIVEVNAETWKVARRIPARPGVYNLAVTPDQRLIATNKRDQSVSVFDLKSGREVARIPTRRKVVHGATVSPDGRYAFVTVEGVGSEPGTIEIIDLESLKIVASVDVPQQAAGIDFWKTEPAK